MSLLVSRTIAVVVISAATIASTAVAQNAVGADGHRTLPPAASAWLHRCSMPAPAIPAARLGLSRSVKQVLSFERGAFRLQCSTCVVVSHRAGP